MTISTYSLFLWVSENCINCLIYISIRVHQLRGIGGIIILVKHHISQKWSRVRGLTVNQVTFHFLLTFLFPLQKIFDVKSQIMSTIHPVQTLQSSSPAGAAGKNSARVACEAPLQAAQGGSTAIHLDDEWEITPRWRSDFHLHLRKQETGPAMAAEVVLLRLCCKLSSLKSLAKEAKIP